MMTTDWMDTLKKHAAEALPEVEVATIRANDRLFVVTEKTTYAFRGTDQPGVFQLETNRVDRPSGDVQITGCCFGASTTIAPGRLFCGGNMEFTYDRGERVMTTTRIKSLHCIHQIER